LFHDGLASLAVRKASAQGSTEIDNQSEHEMLLSHEEESDGGLEHFPNKCMFFGGYRDDFTINIEFQVLGRDE
jgi:hypothetical protein